MHIRPATAADMAAVHDCWLATDFTDPSEYAAMAALGIAPWWPHLYEHGHLLVAEADGVIVGSALVRLLAEAGEKPRDRLLADIGAAVGDLTAACGPRK